jgi:hypothetical protein
MLLNDKPWSYAVSMVNEKTGEQQTVVVTLSDAERDDAMRNLGHTGGDHGPIVNSYAGRRASERVPAGFVPVYEDIKRVVLH